MATFFTMTKFSMMGLGAQLKIVRNESIGTTNYVIQQILEYLEDKKLQTLTLSFIASKQ